MRWTVLVAVVLAGCGGGSKARPDAMPDAPRIDAAADAAPFVMTGQVTDAAGNPLGAASVCMLGHPELACSDTNGDGTWALDVPFLPPPPAVELAMTFTAQGYLGELDVEDEAMPGEVAWIDTAYFGNVAPGTYDLTVTAPGVQCHDRADTTSSDPTIGDWPPSGAGTLGLQVVAGAQTGFLHAYCF